MKTHRTEKNGSIYPTIDVLIKLGLIEMITGSLTDLGIVAITEQRHPRDDNV